MAVIADPNAPERPLPTCCTRRSCASAARAWRRRSSSSTRMPIGSPSAYRHGAGLRRRGPALRHGQRRQLVRCGHVSVEFMHPIIEKRPALPAMALTTDTAFLTAVGNDQDFSMAFIEQLRMLGRAGDLALGISTSGKSANVNRALQAARELGMRTVGFSGRDGGRMPEICDYCFTVPSFSIHRIQETHETLLHILWDLIHVIRGEEDVI